MNIRKAGRALFTSGVEKKSGFDFWRVRTFFGDRSDVIADTRISGISGFLIGGAIVSRESSRTADCQLYFAYSPRSVRIVRTSASA